MIFPNYTNLHTYNWNLSVFLPLLFIYPHMLYILLERDTSRSLSYLRLHHLFHFFYLSKNFHYILWGSWQKFPQRTNRITGENSFFGYFFISFMKVLFFSIKQLKQTQLSEIIVIFFLCYYSYPIQTHVIVVGTG